MPLRTKGIDQTAEIVIAPDDRHRVEGMGFLFGPSDHLVNVFFLHHFKFAGQAHFGIGFLDPLDEGVGLFGFVSAADTAP